MKAGRQGRTIVLREAEVDGVLADVRIVDDEVDAVGPPGAVRAADVEIACGGGALLPGLHDHHLHLLSMAAAAGSVDVTEAHPQARALGAVSYTHLKRRSAGPKNPDR